MRYLVCFRPESSELLNKINLEDKVVLPSSGIHATLWGFSMDEYNEGEVIKKLGGINKSPFQTIPLATDKWINNKSTKTNCYNVLLLKKPNTLQCLHEEVVSIARSFDRSTEEFEKMYSTYGGISYVPHLTISKANDFEFQQDYSNLSFNIQKYFLLKKKQGLWEDVKQFNLKI